LLAHVNLSPSGILRWLNQSSTGDLTPIFISILQVSNHPWSVARNMYLSLWWDRYFLHCSV